MIKTEIDIYKQVLITIKLLMDLKISPNNQKYHKFNSQKLIEF